jgi:hypothetical protein
MLDLPDPLADLILGKLQHSMIADWLKFLFVLLVSAAISFYSVNGYNLACGVSELVSRGRGDLAIAGALLLCCIVNGQKLLKGMVLIAPNEEVVTALEKDFQQIPPDNVKSGKETKS